MSKLRNFIVTWLILFTGFLFGVSFTFVSLWYLLVRQPIGAF